MRQLPFHQARDRLSGEDLSFVSRALARGSREATSLLALMADQEERDRILDLPEVYEALVDTPHCLEVSPRLYFYVALRRLLRGAGLTSRDLADFVAESLAGFVEQRHFEQPEGLGVGGYDYEIDVLNELASLAAGSERRFAVLLFNGRRYLFLLGLFPGVARRRYRKGGPPERFYEERGSLSFREARDHRLADEFGLVEVLDELSFRFGEVSASLRDLRERVAHLG